MAWLNWKQPKYLACYVEVQAQLDLDIAYKASEFSPPLSIVLGFQARMPAMESFRQRFNDMPCLYWAGNPAHIQRPNVEP